MERIEKFILADFRSGMIRNNISSVHSAIHHAAQAEIISYKAEKKRGDLTIDRGAPKSEDMIRVGTELMIGPDLVNGESFRRLQVNKDRIIQEGGFDDQVVDITVKTGLTVLIVLLVAEGPAAVRMMGCQDMDHNFRGNTQRKKSQHYPC